MFTKLFAQPSSNNQFKIFFEKVYVQTDREFYTAGEDIWYKAYLVNAASNYPTASSSNLYVELIAADASIIDKQVIYLNNGYGNGDFRIADTLSAGNYKLRAYTNWMRNFGNNFLFEKNITIKNIAKTTASTKKINTTAPNYTLSFFPEGGSLIANTNNTVAFKAEDVFGKGIICEGSLVNSKGKTVANFKSSYAGMGSFSFIPESNESYDVKAVCNNQSIASDFPFALEKGFVLSINNTNDEFVTATIKTNAATLASLPNTLITVTAKHSSKLFFKDSVRLNSTEASIKIPLQSLPQGIAVITLYDEKLRPNSERLVFIKKQPNAILSAQMDKTSFNANENPSVKINVTNTANIPIKADLSMAVVDANVVPVSSTNIVNYLLLQSELKGDIENPDNYFNLKNPQRLQQLDLLLLTQGWREFVWTKLAQEGIKIKYLPEPGITISGKVTRELSNKPLRDMNITLFAPQAKGDKLLLTKTDSAGKYYLDGVKLFGTQRIKLVSKDNKGNKGGNINIDSLFNPPVATKPFNTIIDTSAPVKNFEAKATEHLTTLNKVKDDEIKQLPGVTVTSKDQRAIVTRNDVVSRFGYKDSVLSPTDTDLKDYGDLENYLQRKLPGAMDDVDTGGLYFLGESTAGGGPVRVYPIFFVENREDIFSRQDYYRLPVNQISKIVLVHGISHMTMQHVYQIHLTLKPGALEKKDPDALNTEVTGYYEARNFYVPQPKMDDSFKGNFLTTLLWVPNVQTTTSGGTRVTIDNKKMKSNFRIVIEGLTENGVPLYSVLNYEAK
jgi:hypothetical protein